MKLLLDSSTVIISFEKPYSNSRVIFDLILEKKLEGVVSEKAVLEVKKVLAYHENERFAFTAEKVLRKNLQIVPLGKIAGEISKWKGKIKEKDLVHLAAAKALGLKYIIALDRDFEPFKEHYTPREFVEKVLRLKGFKTEY